MIPGRDTPFSGLVPEEVLAAVEQMGLEPDGRLMALNSYENRVYRVGIEDRAQPLQTGLVGNAVVIKFYRASRWNDARILEEHAFAAELAAAEMAVAAPLSFGGSTLQRRGDFRFSVFSCWRGSSPELDHAEHRAMLGRALGRMHAIGATRSFEWRGSVRDWDYGDAAREQVLQSGHVPSPLDERYAEISADLVHWVRERWEGAGEFRFQRLHGDCHLGNILWNEAGPVFVDLDDCLAGPVVQDLWMLSSGSPAQRAREWTELLAGYEQFAYFDRSELALVEPLRAVRMLNHAAWIAARWADPAFPRAFPWFGEPRYWERHIDELREQIEAVQDPPLLRL
jgi:Ser/Thr protein kinase RdoA (MazF antagonist)